MEIARYRCSIVWLRRDLRLADHAALCAAAQHSERLVVAFVLDPELLGSRRVGAPIIQFFFDSLAVLREQLREAGSDLALLEGAFAEQITSLAKHTGAQAVFYNLDYDPEMLARDRRVVDKLDEAKLDVHALVDHVFAGATDIVQQSGKPYTVYTAYRKRWQAVFDAHPRRPHDSQHAVRGKFLAAAEIGETCAVPKPGRYGHAGSERFPRGGLVEAERRLESFLAHDIDAYLDRRNLPALPGTSGLSPHLRAGTIGIRACVAGATQMRANRSPRAAANIDGWIGELIWRDFYQALLFHFPRIAQEPFNAAGKSVPYVCDDVAYAAWCAGTTGYPIVDAAMVQLNTTGWMHNRLRMIVASFLTKHLLIDYRAGERYFEQHLADADLASNNGGWQWSASVGTDAAPYFRVFNPSLQGRTFDPGGAFVRALLPVLADVPDTYIHEPWRMPPAVAAAAGIKLGRNYPRPIVDHAAARQRALTVYGKALGRH